MGIMNWSREKVVNSIKRGEITLCLVGLGRIGLPTAAVFAAAGAAVIGVDINRNVMELVNAGKCKFQDEPGLEMLIENVVNKGNLKVTTNYSSAVKESDVIIICVPTPIDESQVPDYSAVRAACYEIGKNMNRDSLVVIESTVGSGTVEDMVVPLLEQRTAMKSGDDFGVASCPERADPGKILQNLRVVPKIVGGITKKSADITAAIYEGALGVRVVKVSDPKTANAVKLTENLFRDVNIALANEFAILYEKLGIDIIEVINACSTKYNFMPHYPGAGVGGPCLPQNPYYLINEGIKVGNIPYLVRMAREINDRMPDHVVMLITEALNEIGKTVRGSKIALLGAAYKPDVHDLQLTPIEKVFKRLRKMGAFLNIYDPMFKGEEVFELRALDSMSEAVTGADCIVVGTAHQEFRNLDIANLAKICRKPSAFIDSRHVVDPTVVEINGFSYRGLGRPRKTI